MKLPEENTCGFVPFFVHFPLSPSLSLCMCFDSGGLVWCSKRMFDEHMTMLSEKMAKKAARLEQMRAERDAKRKVT